MMNRSSALASTRIASLYAAIEKHCANDGRRCSRRMKHRTYSAEATTIQRTILRNGSTTISTISNDRMTVAMTDSALPAPNDRAYIFFIGSSSAGTINQPITRLEVMAKISGALQRDSRPTSPNTRTGDARTQKTFTVSFLKLTGDFASHRLDPPMDLNPTVR